MYIHIIHLRNINDRVCRKMRGHLLFEMFVVACTYSDFIHSIETNLKWNVTEEMSTNPNIDTEFRMRIICLSYC